MTKNPAAHVVPTGTQAGNDAQLEAARRAADLALNENKAERAADREFAEAMRLQMLANGINDVIGGR